MPIASLDARDAYWVSFCSIPCQLHPWIPGMHIGCPSAPYHANCIPGCQGCILGVLLLHSMPIASLDARDAYWVSFCSIPCQLHPWMPGMHIGCPSAPYHVNCIPGYQGCILVVPLLHSMPIASLDARDAYWVSLCSIPCQLHPWIPGMHIG